jgi:hypothetical protein
MELRTSATLPVLSPKASPPHSPRSKNGKGSVESGSSHKSLKSPNSKKERPPSPAPSATLPSPQFEVGKKCTRDLEELANADVQPASDDSVIKVPTPPLSQSAPVKVAEAATSGAGSSTGAHAALLNRDNVAAEGAGFFEFSSFQNIFPSYQGKEDDKVAVGDVVLHAGTLIIISVLVFVLYSGVAGVGPKIFGILGKLSMVTIFYVLIGSGFVVLMFLHVCDVWSWPPLKLTACLSIIAYAYLFGFLFYTHQYPSAPLLVGFLHYPLALAALRYQRGGAVKAVDFHRINSYVLFSLSLVFLVIWLVWLIVEDLWWNNATRDKIQAELGQVHVNYGKTWGECKVEREKATNDKDEITIATCLLVHLTGWFIWSTPVLLVLFMMILAGFSRLQIKVLRNHQDADQLAKQVIGGLGAIAIALWLAASLSGNNMALASEVIRFVMCGALCLFVWAAFSIDVTKILADLEKTTIAKAVFPALRGDAFKGLFFCASCFFITGFLVVEIIVRQLNRAWGTKGESNLFTTRALRVINFVKQVHFVLMFQWTLKWCAVYLVFQGFGICTPIFLAWLSGHLASLSVGLVTAIFYFVGLIMFLLPPVPGVPVYVAAGSIIVGRLKQESWGNIVVGVAYSTVVCLLLKLNAVVCQQKGFGEGLGSSITIQEAVGVHTPAIRAIEKILKRPGLTIEKMCILCGGPDWPTSVLTGILRLSLFQMLLGTLPIVLFGIFPCCLAGASLTEPSIRIYFTLITMLAAGSQGTMALAALAFIAKEQERSAEEFATPRPEHAELVQRSEKAAHDTVRYKEIMTWASFPRNVKYVLLIAVMLLLGCSWVYAVANQFIFRSLTNNAALDSSFADGGLEGDVSNVLRQPLGPVFLGVVFVGCAFWKIYACLASRIVDGAPPETE